jgi:hypothetical protein
MIIIRNSPQGHSPMPPLVSFLSAAAAFFLAASGGLALAQEQTFRLTIKNHQFEPAEFEIPANTKVTLQVKNEDATAEEFESSTLHREKVVPAGKEVNIFVGPLSPGRYEFMGDFNRATARGAIIVK